GVCMPERRHSDARHEVEILTPIDVVQTRSLTSHEGHRLPTVGVEDVLGFSRLYAVECRFHRTTCVHPVRVVEESARVPNRVFLPSAMTTSPTPACNARRQACSFATI